MDGSAPRPHECTGEGVRFVLTPTGQTIVALRAEVLALREKVEDLTSFFPNKHPARIAAERVLRKTCSRERARHLNDRTRLASARSGT